METFRVTILETRRRLGIKEIYAPSIEVAESCLTQLLKEYLDLETIAERVLYIHRSASERKLKLRISNYHFSISIIKSTPA